MDKSFNADSFDFDEAFKKVSEEVNKPNILICGGTGVGKSSFINEVFGEEIAEVGNGKPITKETTRYANDDINVVLYDTEGYEVGEEKQDHFKDEILGIIDKCKQEHPEDLNKHIHQVWYFISAANKRVTETDIEAIELLKKKNIPIAIVLTQIDNVDEQELDSMNKTIRNDFIDIDYFNVCVTEDEEILEAVKPYNQTEQLIEWALENLSDSLKEGFISSLYKNLKVTKEYVNKSIVPKYIASSLATAATPVPFSDAALLAPMQLTMSVHIMKTYGINNDKSAITGVVNSTIISQVGKTIAKTLIGNVAKLIPGFGSIIGGTINAGVAGSLTAALGYTISELSYKYSQSVVEGKPIPLNEIFDSEMIKEYISKFYKKGENSEGDIRD